MDRLGFGFFKLRLIVTVVFIAMLASAKQYIEASYVLWVWLMIEFLTFELDLEDKHKSEWELELSKRIKEKKHGQDKN